MAYFQRNGDDDSPAYCDHCGHGPGFPDNPNGAVPFHRTTCGDWHQDRPWCWSFVPMPRNCTICGADLSIPKPPAETTFVVQYRDGREQLLYVRTDADHPWQFRFTLDYENWRDIKYRESLEQAARREWLAVCQRTWPDAPQYWPVSI